MNKAKKGEGKGRWQRAIIGILLALIMVGSVIAIMVQTGSARDPANGNIQDGDTLFTGECGLSFDTVALPNIVRLEGQVDTPTEGEIIAIADSTNFCIPVGVVEGIYDIINASGGDIGNTVIKNPSITGNVYLAGTVDSIVGLSIPAGTDIKIRASPNFGGLLREASTGNWGKIKIKLIDPDGIVMVNIINATATQIDIDNIDTTGWDTGTWTVKIVSDKTTCNEVDVSSPTYEFTVRSEALDITAVKDEVGKGDAIVLTVSGNPVMYYYFAIENVKAGEEPQILDTADVKYRGTGEGTAGSYTAAWIKTGSDGIADIKISTTGADERTYTMNVYDTYGIVGAYPNATNQFTEPANVSGEMDDDDVSVKVVEARVTFDMPASAVIGEDVTIKGTISAGDKVDILIEDGKYGYWDDEPVDENNEFKVKWDTEGLQTGSYTIDAYIDCPYDSYDEIVAAGIDADGKTTIRLVVPGLTAEQPRNVTTEGDDYTIEGTATGVDDVDIVLIGPNGYPLADPGLDVLNGLEILSTSVTNNEFSEGITLTEGLDLGTWITMVFSPGRDGTYGDLGLGPGNLDGIDTGLFKGKDQDQIKAILRDHTVDVAGSDDLLVVLTFKVETPYVSFDPIASVTIGETLEITGKTNREPETMIVIYTVEGHTYLPAVITEVEWPTPDQGIFNATIDTTYAVTGNYTLRADDGDWNTDMATVEILPAISIFDTGPGTYPSIFGTHNGTITPFYNINVSKIYTYSCPGTGGHTEYVAFYNATTGEEIANGTWNGYQGAGDYHYIEFDSPFILHASVIYNYNIRTGSYPQIIHEPGKEVTGGVINCTEFTDANGKKYNNWIPAIRLE